jgi:hypothetical protein
VLVLLPRPLLEF